MSARTDLVFDARAVGPHIHGIARFALSCLHAIAAADPGFRTTALISVPYHPEFPPPAAWLDYRLAAIPCYGIAEQLRLPGILRSVRAKAYFSPTFTGPLFSLVPSAITIHDLIHVRFAGDYGIGHRLYYRGLVGPLADRCRIIATVSHASAADIRDWRPRAGRKTAVLGNLIEPVFTPPKDRREMETRLVAMGIERPYLLFVGNAKRHKNFGAVFKAYRRILPDFPGLGLVVVGLSLEEGDRGGWTHPGVRYMTPQGGEQLTDLYRGASLLAVPSLSEGFGLPAVEAMACGIPVVASDIPAYREILGAAALFPDPADSEAVATAIRRILSGRSLGERLVEAGRDIAAQRRDAPAFRARLLTLLAELLGRDNQSAPKRRTR